MQWILVCVVLKKWYVSLTLSVLIINSPYFLLWAYRQFGEIYVAIPDSMTSMHLFAHWTVKNLCSTPFKKNNATRLWSIIFLLSWIFIHQVRYVWEACLFAFRLMPNLLGLFYWGACRLRKLGTTSKRKGCKVDRIQWEMHNVISSF